MKLARRLTIAVIVAFALFGVLAPVTHTSGQAAGSFTGSHLGYETNAATHFGTATGGLASPSSLVNGVVYANSDGTSVYALNASTGAKIWSHRLAATNVCLHRSR